MLAEFIGSCKKIQCCLVVVHLAKVRVQLTVQYITVQYSFIGVWQPKAGVHIVKWHA